MKIGVISPELPFKCIKEAHAPKDSSLWWFNEIEAAFAYLLNDMLDRLLIDRALVDEPHACTKKYQRLIEQLHPRLQINFLTFDRAVTSTFDVKELRHFPKLDTLFKNGEQKSVFQPIVEWTGNNHVIHGVECLSRIYFNGHRYAPEFIFNYAAETLRLTNYDKICLMQALRLYPHDKKTSIFINARPQTLISNDFCAWFKALLKQHHLVPEQIVIEVTEQYCNIAEHEMSAQCKNLKDQGVRLAIDDFGSGLSNLSMLEVMKPSYIKISGRFIKNSHHDVNKQKIIKNVLGLAHDFGIIPIVESVELEEEWLKVKALGARLAQGFYFYKPMPREELSVLLKSPAGLVSV